MNSGHSSNRFSTITIGTVSATTRQVVLQPRQRIVIKTVKGFVQNQQLRTAGQRSDEHHLARLAG